jgi:hypothetical protein
MKSLLRVALAVSVAFAAGCGEEKDDPKQCVPESDQAFCARLDATCGAKTATDNCGEERTVEDCGSCSDGASCVANKCEAAQEGCAVPTSFGQATAIEGDGTFAEIDSDYQDLYAEIELNEDPDILSIELIAGYGRFEDEITTGTFTLSGDELNFETCSVCVALSDEDETLYFATGGTVKVTSIDGTFVAELSDVTFEEVTLDESTFRTTPVPNGCKTRIDSLSVSAPIEVIFYE